MKRMTETDRDSAKDALEDEREAIDKYRSAGKRAANPKLKRTFRHALGEEKQHARMFGKSLQRGGRR